MKAKLKSILEKIALHKKLVIIITASVLAVALAVAIPLIVINSQGDNNQGGNNNNGGGNNVGGGNGGGGGSSAKVNYTVNVKTYGGMAMEGIWVYTYLSDDKDDIVASAKTDANGNATLKMESGKSYVGMLDGVPEGYYLAAGMDNDEDGYFDVKAISTSVVLSS